MSDTRKLALVIGGSRGIGKGIALKLADSGMDICITYRSNHDAANAVADEIKAKGVNCETISFDVSKHEETVAAMAKFEGNAPDVLVYNAGITKDNLMVWMNKEDWDAVLRTNLDGFYNVVQPIVFEMVKAKKGRIVVISSTAGQVGQAGQVNYSASKAGLIGAAKSLAREVAKRGIFVNVVAPGFIETDMTQDLPKKQILPLIPQNRFGKVEDVASIVNFLATEENMYIQGQVIGVNGGLVI